MKNRYNYPDSEDFFEPDQHNVAFLNQIVDNGYIGKFIRLCEALQEKRISRIAEDICSHKNVQIVLLAGPSSSGKTSTANRLSVQLMACRKWPVALSMDNWFVDRDKTPVDEEGKKDYESIYSLNLQQFNQDLNDLIAGKEIQLPTYNFQTGKSEYNGETLKLQPGSILVIEGIHALNPTLTESIDEKYKYRVYASPETGLVDINDGRLIRRITRDYKTRGCSAADTIARWASVRRGEEKWIKPYKHLANATFNTAILYELSALRTQAEEVLGQVSADAPEYDKAQQLLDLLQPFHPIPHNEIPMNSLLREFIGGSVFDVG